VVLWTSRRPGELLQDGGRGGAKDPPKRLGERVCLKNCLFCCLASLGSARPEAQGPGGLQQFPTVSLSFP
jgi:hypothetical protein